MKPQTITTSEVLLGSPSGSQPLENATLLNIIPVFLLPEMS